jgi:hypothetical protein
MQGKSTVHRLLFYFLLIMTFHACTSSTEQKDREQEEKLNTKPRSNYQDTLMITDVSVVFYNPDSMQLEKIRELTKKQVFEGTMHEFYYEQRNARLFFQKHWPQLAIIDAENIRYLVFVKTDKQTEIIDLDKFNDAYGIFAFDRKRSPLLINMTNVETEVTNYFQKN